MEKLFERLIKDIEVPIFIIIALLIIIVVMHAATTYHDYWTGKLAKARFEKEFGNQKS